MLDASSSRRMMNVLLVVVGIGIGVAVVSLAPLLTRSRPPFDMREISSILRPWCGQHDAWVQFRGHSAAAAAMAKGKPTPISPAGVSGLLGCKKANSVIATFFFPTAFDENNWLDIYKSGLSLSGTMGPDPVFVGRGWVVVVGWKPRDATLTEGQVIGWLQSHLGVGMQFRDFRLLKT